MRYRFEEDAAEDVVREDRRWRTSRPESPELFLDELNLALEQITSQPHSGTMYGSHDGELVRRVLCKKTRTAVYYLLADDGPVIIAVWGTKQGSGPRFRRDGLS